MPSPMAKELRDPLVGEEASLYRNFQRGVITKVLSPTDHFYRVSVQFHDPHTPERVINIRWWAPAYTAWVQMPEGADASPDGDWLIAETAPWTTAERDRMRHVYAATYAGAQAKLRAHALLLRDEDRKSTR